MQQQTGNQNTFYNLYKSTHLIIKKIFFAYTFFSIFIIKKILMMNWSNRIIHCKGDNNNSNSHSNLSNRSLSKFKKVNLQQKQSQASSNHHLEKSQLKLTSVQKIKNDYLNKSHITNYLNSSQNSLQKSIDSKTHKLYHSKMFLYDRYNSREEEIRVSRKQQMILPENKDTQKLALNYSIQGQSNSDQKDMNKWKELSNQFIPPIKVQASSTDTALNKILSKFTSFFTQFIQISQKIKKEFNNQTLKVFITFQNQILQKFKSFEACIKQSLDRVSYQVPPFIPMSNKNSRQAIKNTILVQKNQNIFKNVQNSSKNSHPISQVLHNVQNTEQSSFSIEGIQKPQNINRPHHFKNKFKQSLPNNNTEPFAKNSQMNQQEIFQDQNNKTSPRKLLRKRTGPSPRVNSFMGNESSLFEQHNDSLHQLKYTKIKDRSASKSVKRLHQKIVSIKKIFNSNMNQKTNDQQELKIIINQKKT